MSSEGGGVEKPIDIKIVDPAALTREERDIAKFKALAKEAEAIERRLKTTKGGLVSGVGAPIQGQLEGFLPTAGGAALPGGRVPRGALAAGVAPAGRQNEFLKLRDKVREMEEVNDSQELLIGNIQNKVNEFSSALRNPGDFVLNAITKVVPVKFVKMLGVIGVIILLVTFIIDRIKKEFGPGGALDIRKRILDEAATIPELQTLLNVRSGTIFYTSDTRVRQEVPQNSSTERLSRQSQRYNELILGSDLDVG